MRAHDIDKLVSVGRPTIAPDASFAVFATSRPDLPADRAVGQLWRIDLPDGEPRRLTRGVADREPALSPDGTRIAFLRTGTEGTAQLHVVAAAGGEPLRVTEAPLGVAEFAWSPDGDRLAFTARVPETGRYGSVEGLTPTAEAPRRITGVRWHANGLGYAADRPAQVFVVAVPPVDVEPLYPPAPRVRESGDDAAPAPVTHTDAVALTSGAESWSRIAWLPGGLEVVGVSDEIEATRRDLRQRLLALRVDGSGTRELVPRDAALLISEVAVAADGAVFLLAADVGADGRDFVAPGTALWILEAESLSRLTDAESVDLGEAGSHITPLGSDVLVQNRTRGRLHLLRATRTGQTSEVLGGDVEVTGHAAAGVRVVAAVSSPASFGELVVIDDGMLRQATAFGSGLAATGVVVPREIEIAGRDGYPVHGWVATPEGEGPFPVLLQIHGGPYASYGVHLFDETQVLVDAGYAVVYCNPRGSAGYGRAHGRSIRQAMGTVDFTDVMDFLDAAIAADDRLAADRLGILGGSYGGYLTAWAIAHDHRFAAAIVERGLLDPVSFQGTSDIGSYFGDEYVGTDAAALERQSPLAVVGAVRTPTLVIHSELDFRCPLEQATRYYSALKRAGTPAEMLVFPGEDHELTRSGTPRHRIQRFEAILDWWARYLPTG